MTRPYLIFFTSCLISLSTVAAVSSIPVWNNLDNLTVIEQDPATVIDVDVGVVDGLVYSDGSLSFAIAGAVSSDTLALSSDNDVNAVGAISVITSDVYLGNGVGRDRIGSIDGANNGQNGSPLKILFSSPLVNAGFETGDTSGWTVFEEEYPDEAGVESDSIPWVRASPAGTGTGTVLLATTTSVSYAVNVVTSPVSQGTYALQLLISGGITCSARPSGQNPDGYCSTHGPYADSTSFAAFNGDQIFVDWSAQNGGDWYEVFGFLIGNGPDDVFGTGDDTETLLFSQRGDTRDYAASNATISADDTYKFRFVSGTYDASGGLGVGASLYVDGVRLVSGTAVSDSVVQSIARLVTFQNSSDAPPAGPRVLTVTAITQDGSSGSTTANITITAVNDAPIITGGSAAPVSIVQGDIITVPGIDPDGTVPVFSIVGGADASLFMINSTTGALSFITAPNISEKQTFIVQVQVSDGSFSNIQLMTITVGDAPPVVTAPADVTVNAAGLLTAVSLGNAMVVDVTDTALMATPSKAGPFAPGTHTIIWSATDSAGNSGQASQVLKVLPLASFSGDQIIDDSGAPQVVVRVYLNGAAADYPVTIPYTVSGTADNPDDHNLAEGSIVIASGKSGSVTFNVVDDGDGDDGETIILSMGTLNNAVAGVRKEHQVTLSEINEAPRVSLNLDQGGLAANSIAVTGNGNVVAAATVVDPNTGDVHSFDWAGTHAALVDIDAVDGTFTFDPSMLTPGVYRLVVSVTDDASAPLQGSAEIDLLVRALAPVLSASSDADGDGIDDATEGYGDTDGDGVPDYLDAIEESNVLSEQSGNANTFLMETDPGLRLRLGSVAVGVANGAGQVSALEVQTQTQIPADSVTNVGSYFDFEISDLPITGQTINLVMAQPVPVPANPVYRKLIDGSWSDFIESSTDSVSSSAGAEGYCPPPSDESYTAGLTPGHWCVQLTISDGGPNDADNKANNRVVDPSGVGALEQVTVHSTRSGGSFSLLALSLLGLLVVGTRLRGVATPASLLVLLTALTPFSYASDAFNANKFSVGAQLLYVDGNEQQSDSNRYLQNAGFDARVSGSDKDRRGWSTYLGYYLFENFQLELGYTDLGETDMEISGIVYDAGLLLDAIDNSDVNVSSAHGMTFAGKYHYDLSEWTSVHGKIGVFSWSSDIDITASGRRRSFDESGTDILYGLGIERRLSNQLSAGLGWQRYELEGEGSDTFQLGLTYHFGQ